MKYNLIMMALLFPLTASSETTRENHVLSMDRILDGQVIDAETYNLELLKNSNSLSSEINDSALLIGSILEGESILSFRISGMDGTSYFLGNKGSSSTFEGTWFSTNGNSGDWATKIESYNGIYRHCLDIQNNGASVGDGYYYIDPDGSDYGVEPFEVYCDMTTKGGGWTLFAHHSDGISNTSIVEPVTPSSYGVLNDERWIALRNAMSVGIITVDEYNKVSFASVETMSPNKKENIITPWNIDSLLTESNGSNAIWCASSSNSCEHNYMTSIRMTGKNYSFYNIAGAAVYQAHSSIKFDEWPYTTSAPYQGHVYSQFDTLKYYLK